MTTVALDVMGGDYAPTETVHGAVAAAREYGIKILLVGDETSIKKELRKHSTHNLKLEIVHASEVVDMGDKQPASAVRKKKDSSIVVATNLVANGQAGGVISAGSTGATSAAALFYLKRIEGIERPCLATVMPSRENPFILADAGANVEATKDQLLQNAFMAIALAKAVLKIKNPRVGLLNIGEEPGKGNTLVKEAYELFAQTKSINFIGNVEGRIVLHNVCDVIVCDGFVGNVFLKTAEGYAKMVATLLREELTRDFRSKIGALLASDSFYRLRKRVDYSEYGGGQLLGVKGVCVVAHGSSKFIAIKNAIRITKDAIQSNLVNLTESMIKDNLKSL